MNDREMLEEWTDMNEETQLEVATLPGPLGSAQIDLVCSALADAQGDMEAVEMDSKNPFFGSRYSSLGAVIKASKTALKKYGLAIVQKAIWEGSKLSMHSIVTHKSGQWLDYGTLETEVVTAGRNSPIQGAGGLITYMRRYSRAAICQLYSDEDLDGNEPEEPKEKAKKPSPPAKEASNTAALRMRALNVLQAAPGQPNRATVEAFLLHRGWIKQGEQCESWQEAHVPKSKNEMNSLAAAIQQFEADRHESAKDDPA